MPGLPVPQGDHRKHIYEMLMGAWDLAQTNFSQPMLIDKFRRRVSTLIYRYDLFGRDYDIQWIETAIPNRTIKVHMTLARLDEVGEIDWKVTFRNFDISNRYRWRNVSDPKTGLGVNGEARLEGKTRKWFFENRRSGDANYFGRTNIFFEGNQSLFDSDFALFRVSGTIP